MFPGELRNLGHGLLDHGDTANALIAFELARELHPDLSPILLDLGRAHEKAGNDELADEYFLRYLEADPTHLEIADKVGFERALQSFKKSAGNGSLDEHAINMLGYRLMKDQRMEDALRIFELNVTAHPDSWNVYDSLGEAYMVNGNKKLAIENYQKSLQLNPDNSNAKSMLMKLAGN